MHAPVAEVADEQVVAEPPEIGGTRGPAPPRRWRLGAGIGSGPPRNPEIVPSSLAKMKRAGLVPVPLVTTKVVPPLNTMPVGALCPPPAPGTTKTAGTVAVPTLYSVERPVPL